MKKVEEFKEMTDKKINCFVKSNKDKIVKRVLIGVGVVGAAVAGGAIIHAVVTGNGDNVVKAAEKIVDQLPDAATDVVENVAEVVK